MQVRIDRKLHLSLLELYQGDSNDHYGESMVDLSYGGTFDEFELLEYVRQSERNFIIQGQSYCFFLDHPKLQSLDYWLRPFGNSPDTTQANNDIMAALVATGLFVESRNLLCPDSDRRCKGLVISE